MLKDLGEPRRTAPEDHSFGKLVSDLNMHDDQGEPRCCRVRYFTYESDQWPLRRWKAGRRDRQGPRNEHLFLRWGALLSRGEYKPELNAPDWRMNRFYLVHK